MSGKLKVSVMAFHQTPLSVIDACNEACWCDGNTALLNTVTNGMSCEQKSNPNTILEYLDTKHNDLTIIRYYADLQQQVLAIICVSTASCIIANTPEALPIKFPRPVEYFCCHYLTYDAQ
eukprot:8910354-Ditylum_brightwellii.AAC.1